LEVNRTADGTRISGNVGVEGDGHPPMLVVQTDATVFDDLGTAVFAPAAEFRVELNFDFGGHYIDGDTCSGVATLERVYQPAPEPACAAILLVPASWHWGRRRR
jgi:hypothetical protein